MPVSFAPSCLTCARWLGLDEDGNFICDAFPFQIPLEILSGENDHRSAVAGDHGLRYVPRKTQAEVGYEAVAAMPAHSCDRCKHFQRPFACQLVAGVISPRAWCKLWAQASVAQLTAGIEVRGDAVQSEDGPLAAAGVLFVAGDKMLLMRRKDGYWGLPGGKLEPGESAEEAAAREAEEETGRRPNDLQLWTRRVKDGVDFSTYLSRIDEPFEPRYNDEHDAHEWAPVLDYVSSSMDELGL